MERPYTLRALLLIACTLPIVGSAQMDYYIASSPGSRFNDINDHGVGVSGGAYFDFATETWTLMEDEATEMVSINNAGEVAGSMFLDEALFILQPAYKQNGTWHPIGWFPGTDPEESSFSTYSISPNGEWVTGQMSVGCCDFRTFRYHTVTQELISISNPNYVAVAGYVITNDGAIGGWADDEPATGTRRIPVYITPDLVIIPVAPQLPEFNTNAVNDINASLLMAGDFDNRPFLYDWNTGTFTHFDIPAECESATFTSVSDNGVAVGYAQRFGEFGSLLREALVFHPDLGAQPVFLKDVLLSHGVDINAPSGRMGTAIAISPNGEYVAGWDDQAPFFANGWVVYLGGSLTTGIAQRPVQVALSVFPNPAAQQVTLTAGFAMDAVAVYNAQGQLVAQHAVRGTLGVLDLSPLRSGVYALQVTSGSRQHTVRLVKE